MPTNGWLTGVRAVAFDAVGTLITPDPAAPAVYAAVGRRHGSRLDAATITTRFRTAFRAEEDADRATGWRTDEVREERRWRAIVAAVLDDVADGEACFRELWDHFARPTAWRCDPAASPVLAELTRRGLTIALASNFDGRLHGVVAGLPPLALVRSVVVSSEVGCRKPAPAFFDALVRAVGCAANEVILIGDDYENDYVGATAAGLRAVLLDPTVRMNEALPRIESLTRLIA